MSLLNQWFGDSPDRQSTGLAGRWFTSFGSMALQQSGDRITGTYGPNGTENTIEGSVTNGVLAFRYAEDVEQGAGTFRMKRANHFSGTYLADGRPRAMPWLGWRGFDGLWDTSIGRLRLIEGTDGVQAMHEFPGAQLTCKRAGDRLTIDLASGKTVWSDVLPAGGQATPMTYEANGRQYVVIYAGGHHFMETPIGDEVVAYALP